MISSEYFLQAKDAEVRGSLDQAIQLYEKVLETNRAVLGQEHPDVAFINNSLGAVWFKKGEYQRAIVHMEDALNSLQNICSSDHPMVAQACQNLGRAWSYQDNDEKALYYYQKALSIYKREGMTDQVHILEKKIEILSGRAVRRNS